MKRIMLRVEDDLHEHVNAAAHDARLSMNSYVIGVLEEKVGDDA